MAAEGVAPRHLVLGREAEALAAAHLEAAGAEILLRNYRRRRGELDLVAKQAGVLLIVEVRCRSRSTHGGGAASVDRTKQRRITAAAHQLLQQRRDLARFPVRFDVVTLEPKASNEGWQIDWVKHAFDASY